MKTSPILKGFYYPPTAEPDPGFDELAAPAPAFVEVVRLLLEATVERPIVLPDGELLYRSDLSPCHCGKCVFDLVVIRRETKLGTIERSSIQCPDYYDPGHRPDFKPSEIVRRLGLVDVRTGVLTLYKGVS